MLSGRLGSRHSDFGCPGRHASKLIMFNGIGESIMAPHNKPTQQLGASIAGSDLFNINQLWLGHTFSARSGAQTQDMGNSAASQPDGTPKGGQQIP